MGENKTNRQKRIVQELSFDGRTAKRVRWTEWEFGVEAPHQIRITNASYGAEKDDHEYLVTVANHEDDAELYAPIACDCQAYHFTADETACKHMVAVAVCGGPVLLSAAMNSTSPQRTNRSDPIVVTDSGKSRPQNIDRDVEPERARERTRIEAYARAPADDREARADELGLKHVDGCSEDSNGIECWRCYYVQER